MWEFPFVKWSHSTGCCLLSFCQQLYPTVFPHSLLICTCSGLLHSQPCQHSKEWPNTLTKCFLESWTYQFCSWFPSMTVCLTFAHSCSAKHPKPKNLKFVTVSGKQERRCFLHACFESDQLILKNFLSHVLKPFSFFKTFLSHSVVWKLCAFISLIISYLSSFCCFLFVGHVVVELEGEKLQKLETRL